MKSADTSDTILVICADPLVPVSAGGAARLLKMTDYLRAVGFRIELLIPFYGRSASRELCGRFDVLHTVTDSVWWMNETAKSTLPASIASPLSRGLERMIRKRHATRRTELVNGNPSSLVIRKINPALCDAAKELLTRLRPRAVIGLYAWTAKALESAPAGTIKIIDTIDIQHLRRTRAQEAGGDLPGHACTREEEVRELSRADVLLAIQRHEADLLREMCPDKFVYLVEHAEDTGMPLPSPADSRRVLFVGSRYDPNVQGIRRFMDGPWRDIRREVPDAELVICGTVCSELSNLPEGVSAKGRVDDLAPFYRDAAVVINPVPYGSGLKIKSVEALAYGKCLVATPSGVTGLEEDVDASFHVCEIEAMAGPIVSLLLDPDLRAAEECKTRAYAGRRFAARNVYRDLERLLRRGLATKPDNALTFATPSRRSLPARIAPPPGGAGAQSSGTAG